MLLCLFLACPGLAGEIWDVSDESPTEDVGEQAGGRSSIWPDGMGNGLGRNVNEIGLSIGASSRKWDCGAWNRHDVVLGRVEYARLRTGVIGHGLLRGSLEGRLEGWAGAQYDPENACLLGFTPALRYNLATGTRWMPFLDGGAGVLITDIGMPDLSTTFEFNLQIGTGTYYFLKDDLALTLEYRFLHMSNANIDTPNVGVNCHVIYLGLSRFF